MASTSGSAAKRSRASTEQLSGMIDFLMENQGLAGGKFQRLHGKLEYEKKWAKMAEKLNAIGGAIKSVEQWHNVWRDLKSRTSVRVRDRKKQQCLTGNRPIEQAPLTDLEKREIALIGGNYIEGHDAVLDSVPLEEELQLLMEDGVEIAFNEMAPEIQYGTESEAAPSTPKTPRQTPRRSLKRKRTEKDDDVLNRFLGISEKQTEIFKMLADNNGKQIEATLAIAQAMNVMGEGLKACAEAFNRLSSTLGSL